MVSFVSSEKDDRQSLRAGELFAERLSLVYKQTDCLLAVFMVLQWIACVLVALWTGYRSGGPFTGALYQQLLPALLLGGIIAGPAVALALLLPGRASTRHVMAVCQILISALLIHISGGRLETNFHVFASLAVLAFYRDWAVLVTASAVAGIENLLFCLYWLPSAASPIGASHRWWLEPGIWVLFEDIFLAVASNQNLREMRANASRQAQLEAVNQYIEDQVAERTAERDVNARLASEAAHSLAAIVQSSDDAIIGKALDGKITSWNRGAEKLYGYSADEIVGKNVSILVPARATGELNRTVGKLRLGKQIESYETVRRRKDGAVVQVSLTESSIFNADGTVAGIASIARDITQRKESEAREKLQHQVTRILADAKTLKAAAHDILTCLCAHTGWEVGEIWHVDRKENVLRLLHTVDSGGGVCKSFCQLSCELFLRPGQGLPGVVWESKSPLWLAEVSDEPNFPRLGAAQECGLKCAIACPMVVGSEVMGVLGFFSRSERKRDDAMVGIVESVGKQIAQFVERKLAEDLRRESEARTRAIVENAADGIITFSAEGVIESVNDAALRIFACCQEQFLGANLDGFIRLMRDGKMCCDAVKCIAADRQLLNVHQEGIATRADGSEFPVDFVASEVALNNRIIYTAIVRDITERKEVERHVSEFYSIVSHELRSPLTSILGAMGLMEGGMAGELPQEAAELIAIAKTNCERLIRLINDILDIRKIEAGKLELRIKDVSVQELVETALSGLQGMAELSAIKLVQAGKASYVASCDRDRVIQVLTNLISNAIKFSTAGTGVSVSVAPANGGRLRFSVSDQGPGIREDQLHRLFGKFQQLDSSDTRQIGGTGLGLAICKAIVRQHGGEIGVDTKVGTGSTFWFDLPWKGSLAREDEPRPESPLTVAPYVLLVEDDAQTARALSGLLAAQGYRVRQAVSLSEAETRLGEEIPDAILLDVGLPDGNGLDFLRQLSLRPRLQDIPAVILSGMEPGEDIFELSVIVDWLTKPADEDRILRTLNRAVRRRPLPYVLVVDDDPSVRAVLSAQLQSLSINCVLASDGVEAINKISSLSPDLIVLDVGLPGSDGFAVVDILKAGKHAAMPLIVYSGQDLSCQDRNSLTLGVTRHLTKSRTTSEQLLATVRELLHGVLPGCAPGRLACCAAGEDISEKAPVWPAAG